MMHSFLLRSCVLLNVLTVGASAQFTVTFDQTYMSPAGGPYTSLHEPIAHADGGFYAVIQRYHLQQSNYVTDQNHLVRLDAQGLVVWSTPLSSDGKPAHLAVDAQGNVYAAVGLATQIRVASFASDATPRWSTLLPAGASSTVVELGVTTAGGTVVAHWDGANVFHAALDATGTVLHDVPAVPDTSSTNFPPLASIRADGTVAVATRFALSLVRADGTAAWTQNHGLFVRHEVVSGPAGEIVLPGMSPSGRATIDVRDAAGALLWSHSIAGPLSHEWRSVRFDVWGGLAAAGQEWDGVHWDSVDGIAASFDAQGGLRWFRSYQGPAGLNDGFFDVLVDRSGTITAAGFANGNPIMLLLVSSWDREGNPLWTRNDPGPHAEFPESVIESAVGDVVIAATRRTFNLGSPPDNPYYDPTGCLIALRQDFRSICIGDGVGAACPCGNVSTAGAGEGCKNSSDRGARLAASGQPHLTADTLVLSVEGTTPSAPGVYFQGSLAAPPVAFGDGLRCAGGSLRRMYSRTAQAGASSVPSPGDPSLSVRSAATGDGIGAGSSRVYQVIYRDVAPTFCPSPIGAFHNLSSGVVVTWSL